MEDLIQRASAPRGAHYKFETRFDYEGIWPSEAEGWSINGYYQTSTSYDGKSTIWLDAKLIAPRQIDPKADHYIGFVFGSTKLETSEILRCWWKPKKNIAKENSCWGDFTPNKVDKFHSEWIPGQLHTQQDWKIVRNWSMSSLPYLNRNEIHIRGKRPFDCKDKNIKLKLGRSDLQMFFVFHSTFFQGKTKLYDLILNDSIDVVLPEPEIAVPFIEPNTSVPQEQDNNTLVKPTEHNNSYVRPQKDVVVVDELMWLYLLITLISVFLCFLLLFLFYVCFIGSEGTYNNKKRPSTPPKLQLELREFEIDNTEVKLVRTNKFESEQVNHIDSNQIQIVFPEEFNSQEVFTQRDRNYDTNQKLATEEMKECCDNEDDHENPYSFMKRGLPPSTQRESAPEQMTSNRSENLDVGASAEANISFPNMIHLESLKTDNQQFSVSDLKGGQKSDVELIELPSDSQFQSISDIYQKQEPEIPSQSDIDSERESNKSQRNENLSEKEQTINKHEFTIPDSSILFVSAHSEEYNDISSEESDIII